MQKSELKNKPNSVFKTVAKPSADSTRQWRVVEGAIMEHQSDENRGSW